MWYTNLLTQLLTHLQAILLALDRKDREREMVSVLLAELHPRTLSEEQIGEGFTAIMLSCEVVSACTASFQRAVNLHHKSRAAAEHTLMPFLGIYCQHKGWQCEDRRQGRMA